LGIVAVTDHPFHSLVQRRPQCRRTLGRALATKLVVMPLTLAAVFYLSIGPQTAIAEERSTPPVAVAPNASDQELMDAMRQIDCASLRIRTAPGGARVISGTVPNDAERTRLVELASRLAPSGQLGIDIAVAPPPLCRSLLAFDRISPVGAVSDAGIDARLAGGGSTLREGDPIHVEVTAGSTPVNLRIDYFSLDGQVLHMLPNRDRPVVTLAAGARRVFGASGDAGDAWTAGGAPFGTEFIAVTATPQGLGLGPRPDTELAATYLRDLESALLRSHQAGRGAPAVATVLVHTSEREQVATTEQPAPKPEGAAHSTQSEQPNAPPVPAPSEPAAPVLPTPAAGPSPAATSEQPAAAAPATPVPDPIKPGIRGLLFGRSGIEALNIASVVLGAMAVAAVLTRRRREMATQAGLEGAAAKPTGLFRRILGTQHSDRSTAGRQGSGRPGYLKAFGRSAGAQSHAESFMNWAGGNRVTLALVFTDIVGSTALGESLKDQRMGELRTAHFARSSKLIAAHGGHEIKTIGDSVMVAFRTVDNALDYACALHRDPGGADLPGGAQLRIRAGIHIGPMSVEKADVFGRAVNFAARVIGAISGSEIWVSEQAKADIDALGAGHHQDLQWQRHENIEVKGFTGAVALWSLVTDPEPVSEPAEMRGSVG
jgi:class 3 adenylate cyclase